jgi:hypothetical protein
MNSSIVSGRDRISAFSTKLKFNHQIKNLYSSEAKLQNGEFDSLVVLFFGGYYNIRLHVS